MAKDNKDQPKQDAPKPSRREQKAQKVAKASGDAMRTLAKGGW